jgi:hypothetical protein
MLKRYVAIFMVLLYIMGGVAYAELPCPKTPDAYVKLLNMRSEQVKAGYTFTYFTDEAERLICCVKSPHVDAEIRAYKDRFEKIMQDMSIDWYEITHNSTIYLYDKYTNLVLIFEKGSLIEPGNQVF